jgi:hypothetical protein
MVKSHCGGEKIRTLVVMRENLKVEIIFVLLHMLIYHSAMHD